MARTLGLIALLLASSVFGAADNGQCLADRIAQVEASSSTLQNCIAAGGCPVTVTPMSEADTLATCGSAASGYHVRAMSPYCVNNICQNWDTCCSDCEEDVETPTQGREGPPVNLCHGYCGYVPDMKMGLGSPIHYWRGSYRSTGNTCSGDEDPEGPEDEACAPGEICLDPQEPPKVCRTTNGVEVCVPLAPDSQCAAGDQSALCVGLDEPPPPPPDPPIEPDTPPDEIETGLKDDDGSLGPAPPINITIHGYDGAPEDPEDPDDPPEDPDDPPGDPGDPPDDDPVDDPPPDEPCEGIHCSGTLGTCVTDPDGPGCEPVDGDGDPETPPNPYCASNPGSVTCNGYCDDNPSAQGCAESECNPRVEQCDGNTACQLDPGAPGCAGFCTAHPGAIGCPGFCAANGDVPGCSDGLCNPQIEECGQCVQNPNSPGCSDGECDPETEDCDDGEVSGGGDCDTAPECSGDEILCAVLFQQWETRCALEPGEDEDEVEPPTKEQVTDETDIDPASMLPAMPGLGACPQMPSFSVFGRTYNVDSSGHLCDLMRIASVFIVLFATYISARIVLGDN